MVKVFIDRDSSLQYFLWDAQILEILPQPEHVLSDVPEELLEEYNSTLAAYTAVQYKLRSYYDSRYFRK